MCRPSIVRGADGSILSAGAGAWCPAFSRLKRERMVRAEGVEPSRAVKLNGFSYRLRLSPPDAALWSDAFGLRSGLSLHRPPKDPGIRCCPSSLYTFPAGTFRPGLARDCHVTGFPEFGQFCIAGFPTSTQNWLKSVASACSATPAWPVATIDAHHTLAKGNLRREVCARGFLS